MITKHSKNIFIADDSEFFRVKLSDIITEAGHRARLFNDGRGVIATLQESSDACDLIMLDLQMPESDGFTVLEWIKKNNLTDKLPVLAMTGAYEPTHVLDQLKELGAVGLMTKMYSPEQVLHRVNQLLFPDKVDRGEARLPIPIPVDCTTDNAFFTGHLLNLSASGLFLHTTVKLQADTAIILKFSLPDSDKIMDVNGLVKWYYCLPSHENLFGGAGVCFLNLTPEDQEILREFVQREIVKLGLNE